MKKHIVTKDVVGLLLREAVSTKKTYHRKGCCWVRCTHCSDYEARGASGNYEARGASGDYKARGASGDYEAWGASGGKYEARMEIFCILAAVNRFSWISWKEESR
jgi:hypothetical protein